MVLSEPTKAEECRGRQQEWGWEGLESVRYAEANGLVDTLWDTL